MNWRILILMSTNMMFGIGYSMLEILFPLEAKKYGTSETTSGIIFSSISIPNIIIIPLVPYLSQKINKRLLFTTSTLIIIISTIAFGLASLIKRKNIFEIYSFICRFSQGIGVAISQTMIYSFSVSLSENNKEINLYMGLMEFSFSLGQAIGPFYASFLYNIFNFTIPFFILGFIVLFSLPLYYYINIQNSNDEISGFDFLKLILNLKIFLTFIALIIAMMADIFYEPILENYLIEKYNFSSLLVSLYFDIPVVTFFIAIYLINPFLEKYGTKFQITLSLLLMSISLSSIKLLTQNSILLIFQFIILGFSEAPIIISSMEDFLISLKEINKFSEEYSNDLASSFFTFSVSLGATIGPIIGAYYSEKKGFDYSCFVISIISFFWFIVFGVGLFNFISIDFKNRNNYHNNIKDINCDNKENLIKEGEDS